MVQNRVIRKKAELPILQKITSDKTLMSLVIWAALRLKFDVISVVSVHKNMENVKEMFLRLCFLCVYFSVCGAHSCSFARVSSFFLALCPFYKEVM